MPTICKQDVGEERKGWDPMQEEKGVEAGSDAGSARRKWIDNGISLPPPPVLGMSIHLRGLLCEV